MWGQQVCEGSPAVLPSYLLSGCFTKAGLPNTADFSPCKPGVEPFSTTMQLLLRCCLAVRVVAQLDFPLAHDLEMVEWREGFPAAGRQHSVPFILPTTQ